MDDRRKYAYRYLLYHGFLAIRPIAWLSLSWNPLAWYGKLRSARSAGAVADWLHNLAHFSALDFQHFDEARFWREFESLMSRYPEVVDQRLRWAFDHAMSEKLSDHR